MTPCKPAKGEGQTTSFSGIPSALRGVRLPPLPTGRPTNELREQWLSTCEVAMARGVRRPGTFARMTGVTPRTAKAWMSEVEARWQADADTDASNIRREQLYREAAEVAERAWTVGALRVVLESIRRRARLCGIDGPAVDLVDGIDGGSALLVGGGRDQDASADGEHEPTLAEIGREVAKLLSAPQVER